MSEEAIVLTYSKRLLKCPNSTCLRQVVKNSMWNSEHAQKPY